MFTYEALRSGPHLLERSRWNDAKARSSQVGLGLSVLFYIISLFRHDVLPASFTFLVVYSGLSIYNFTLWSCIEVGRYVNKWMSGKSGPFVWGKQIKQTSTNTPTLLSLHGIIHRWSVVSFVYGNRFDLDGLPGALVLLLLAIVLWHGKLQMQWLLWSLALPFFGLNVYNGERIPWTFYLVLWLFLLDSWHYIKPSIHISLKVSIRYSRWVRNRAPFACAFSATILLFLFFFYDRYLWIISTSMSLLLLVAPRSDWHHLVVNHRLGSRKTFSPPPPLQSHLIRLPCSQNRRSNTLSVTTNTMAYLSWT